MSVYVTNETMRKYRDRRRPLRKGSVITGCMTGGHSRVLTVGRAIAALKIVKDGVYSPVTVDVHISGSIFQSTIPQTTCERSSFASHVMENGKSCCNWVYPRTTRVAPKCPPSFREVRRFLIFRECVTKSCWRR